MSTITKKQTGVTIKKRSPLTMVATQMGRSKKFLVMKSQNFIKLSAIIRGKTVAVRVEKMPDSELLRFSLNVPFTSKVSFFDYAQNESRFTRDKEVIKVVIDKLKKFEVWHLFDKSFLTINPHNKVGKGSRIKQEYDSLING